MLIFEKSQLSDLSISRAEISEGGACDIPANYLRDEMPHLPQVSELQVVRHFTCLSQKNFSVDTHFYPLGSCTMKYNPRCAHRIAMLAGFVNRHPYAREKKSQGFLQCAYELQEFLKTITGLRAVSLAPMAGAQGEFAGVAMIRAYHESRGDSERQVMLVPDAAHGTNPASAIMCGYEVREIPTGKDGDIDLDELQTAVGPTTAGIMLTNPSTLGVFDRKITQMAEIVHKAGGLLYYDGANLNAILGKVTPASMGFDVVHLNLHKTFATPHGGGGPGAGPIAANERLASFMPMPIIGKRDDHFALLTKADYPDSIGRLSTFYGNAGVLLRALVYIYLLGHEGLHRVAEFSTLNANYLMLRLREAGFQIAFPERRASHEFIITLKKEAKEYGVNAMDFAKRLLDYGFHAPTVYFPLLIPECFLIEPTETESKQTLDDFVDAMSRIREEARAESDKVHNAPHTLPVKRLDDVKAARELDVVFNNPGC